MDKMQKRGAAPAGLVVAVVGSRGVEHCHELTWRLRELHEAGRVARVVSGGAVGVDAQAAAWAAAAGVPCTEHRPDYHAHGAGAPLVRNLAVVRDADLVLVVWDGASRGTLNAARKAAKLGKPLEWLLQPAPGSQPVAGGLGL